jgi:hypothetical protein
MSRRTAPIVYVSHSWRPERTDFVQAQIRMAAGQNTPKEPPRRPDPFVEELADQLRAQDLDVRFDIYSLHNRHGFHPPLPDPTDPREPWRRWAENQVAESDAVILYCTPEYIQADPLGGDVGGPWWNWAQPDFGLRTGKELPGLWWDWLAIARECVDRPQKFIPVGRRPYDPRLIPAFLRDSTYLDLSMRGAFDGLVQRIRAVWREGTPRTGVFVSYAHADDESWYRELQTHLSWLRTGYQVDIWSDRNIRPGELTLARRDSAGPRSSQGRIADGLSGLPRFVFHPR